MNPLAGFKPFRNNVRLRAGTWAAIRAAFLERLFPRGCALCGKSLSAKDALYGICSPCRETLILPAAEWGRCSRCGQPLISEIKTCLSCRNGPERSFDRVLPLFPYVGKYRKLLKLYKFGSRPALGRFFVRSLLEGGKLLDTVEAPGPRDMIWVPVPPRPGKIKASGWDQVEHLARLLERIDPAEGPVRISRCLERLPSESQKKLDRRGRKDNLVGKIIVREGKAKLPVPKTALVFDDVYTTGSTMDACAAALKSAGTEKVYGLCLCYD